MSGAYFTPASFAFLEALRRNNRRDWFEDHRERYEALVREPALRLIADMAEPLAAISPHITAVARKVGGSLFRVHRDTRFSKDKTPYKTHIGIRFAHAQARSVHAPMFYLHIDADGSFVGGGLWRPDGKQLQAIRTYIRANPAGWTRAAHAEALQRQFRWGGSSLRRPPHGVDPGHPLIEDLKRKDFVASRPIEDAVLTSERLTARLIRDYRQLAPLLEYLCDALDLPF